MKKKRKKQCNVANYATDSFTIRKSEIVDLDLKMQFFVSNPACTEEDFTNWVFSLPEHQKKYVLMLVHERKYTPWF